MSMSAGRRLPRWFRQEVPDPAALGRMKKLLVPSEEGASRLHTVCEGARCPNLGGCWGRGTATFMLLGSACTRACRFCAVPSGSVIAPDSDEPGRVAQAVQKLGLKYVVLTSVTRDDLPDQGAMHFFRTVREVKTASPAIKVEVLVPDFSGSETRVASVLESGVDVFGHNIETVRRLSRLLRPQADHVRSLAVLRFAQQRFPSVPVKSGLMVGLGETDDEVLATLEELKVSGVSIVTIGQYLSPGVDARHAPVARFVPPEIFDMYRDKGLAMGFQSVVCGPLVRSSYLAEQAYNAWHEDMLRFKERAAA